MIVSMEPVLKRGYTAWDRDVLPVDEFAGRLAAVRSGLAARNLDALVIVNYSLLGAMFEYADLAYVGGLQSGGVVIVYRDREPTLLTFGGGRELFFTREQTWIEEVVPGRGRTFEAAQALLAENGVAQGRIGTTGLGTMPHSAVERFRQAFAGYRLESFDEALAALRLVKRPRELLALGVAKDIADQAAAAALACFDDGADNIDALLEAERVARFNKARDVRVLATMGTMELRPFEGRLPGRYAPLLLWVAAQYQGYWAEAAVTSGRVGGGNAAGGGASAGPHGGVTLADTAVAAMAAAVAPGIAAGDIADAALGGLQPELRRVALQYGLGGTVGLAQCDGVSILPGSTAPLPAGAVAALTCCLPVGDSPSIASRMVQVTGSGGAEVPAVSLG